MKIEIILLISAMIVIASILIYGQATGRIHPFGQKLRRRKVDTPTRRTIWQEWPNDGSPPIRHSSDPGRFRVTIVDRKRQERFPRSKKRRIRLKWRKDRRN